MKKIAHIIQDSAFTLGYIRFMNQYIKEYNHTFFVICSDKKISVYKNKNNVICLKSYFLLPVDRQNKEILKSCDKVIVSGFWNAFSIAGLGKSILRKTYLHFWGGDFYTFRDHVPFYKPGYYHNRLKLYCITHCAAVIFLLDSEHEMFQKITKIKKKYYVGVMPADPLVTYDYTIFSVNMKKNSTKTRVLLGNSATKENQHMEAFHLLEKWKDKIEVMCPLSYGEDKYKAQVLKEGKRILGNAFSPILNYMDQQSYIHFLATCDIGVFNNNRQQAMGNISILLLLRKKIYIRSDTSMWTQFEKDGYVLHDIETLSHLSFEEFLFQAKEEKQRNQAIKKMSHNPDLWAEQWNQIFQD